jgi:hypothetical protein
VHVGADPGSLVTPPFTFTGSQLQLNYATSAGGQLRAELQTAAGEPIPGFTLADCQPLVGDSLEQRLTWKSNPSLAGLAGQPVRLHFAMLEADLYAIQFVG